jgi:hypothetical protein
MAGASATKPLYGLYASLGDLKEFKGWRVGIIVEQERYQRGNWPAFKPVVASGQPRWY